MSKLEQALELLQQSFDETYRAYDSDGDAYYTCTSKEWGRYQKVVANIKNMIGKS